MSITMVMWPIPESRPEPSYRCGGRRSPGPPPVEPEKVSRRAGRPRPSKDQPPSPGRASNSQEDGDPSVMVMTPDGPSPPVRPHGPPPQKLPEVVWTRNDHGGGSERSNSEYGAASIEDRKSRIERPVGRTRRGLQSGRSYTRVTPQYPMDTFFSGGPSSIPPPPLLSHMAAGFIS